MSEKKPKALYGKDENPLKLGDIEIPCYVLDNEKRVLVRAGMYKSLGMKEGTGSRSLTTGDRLVKFINGKRISPYISNELTEMIINPIGFTLPNGGNAYGYDATILPEICEAVLKAREDGILQKQQLHIAKQCEILVRGLATVGIIALVDEATGYQRIRARDALHEILERFISKQIHEWSKTFQDEFYEEIFRLRGWDYIGLGFKSIKKRPMLVGKLTNDIVYDRLAPYVKDELKRITPRDDKGNTTQRYFQRLTKNEGYLRLKEHLAAVTALMKAATSWDGFYRSLQRALPKYEQTRELPLDD